MRYIVFSLLGLVMALGGIQTPTSAHDAAACGDAGGLVTRHDYTADAIQTRMFYSVYTPPCYAPDETSYPVLYLLHGSNDDDGHWLRLGLQSALDDGIRDGRLPPMIVVLPFGNWIANENVFGDASWYGVFINQLMPIVEEAYAVSGNRATRAIGGISRGGFWAYHIAFRQPGLFGRVGGHSAFFDEYHAPETFNPLDLASAAPGIEALALWLDRGIDDYAASGLDLMHQRLQDRGVSHHYQIYPEGQHNNDYWRQHIETYLTFYSEDWPLPSPPVDREAASPGSRYLLMPVVALRSLQSDLTLDEVNTVLGGFLSPSLVLDESTAAVLATQGIVMPPGTTIVSDDALQNTLARDTTRFSLLPLDRVTPDYRVLTIGGQHPLDWGDDYPLGFDALPPNFHPDLLTRLVMSGVTALTRGTTTALDESGLQWAAGGVAPYVTAADFFHVSNEVSIVPGCPNVDGPRLSGVYSFCSKLEHFGLLHLLDVDIVELTGNHNNDFGYDAYLNTLAWYQENGIATVGGGTSLAEARSPLLLEHNGNSIALLACNWIGPYFALVNEDPTLRGGVRPGAAFCDRDWLGDAIPQLKADHDMVVVSIQYLELDQYYPSSQQRQDFQWVAEQGADVVLGSQAHFPQGLDLYATADGRTAYLHYGLGNLFFDQQFFAGERFFMDQLFVYDGRLLFVDLFTGVIEGQARPRPMTADERLNFLYLILVENHGR